jgi:conjugal transfer pilus assembly protein TraD
MSGATHAPCESLLRSPIEWYSAAVSGLSAWVILAMPAGLGVSEPWASLLCLLLTGLAARRGYQGWRVVSYQYRLTQLPYYALRSSDIPVSDRHLFLGKGFRWQGRHTQRLREVSACRADRLFCLRMTHAYQQLKKVLWHMGQRYGVWPWVLRGCRTTEVGGEPALHGVSRTEQDVRMNLTDRGGHMLVVGTTGVGKTRFAEVLLSQDIRRGDAVIMIDPKGDVDLLRRMVMEATLAGREHDLRIFHLGFPGVSARYNPIGQFARLTEVANRIANQLPGTGDSAAFKEFGWKFINTVTKALVAMGKRPTYRKLNFYIHHIEVLLMDYLQAITRTSSQSAQSWVAEYISAHQGTAKALEKAWRAYVKAHELARSDDVVAGLLKACEYDKTYYDKITASLGPLLDKLTTGRAAQLLTPDYGDLADKRPILDWMQVIRNRQIVYVGLDALTDSTIAASVGNAMLADLVSVAGRIYNYGIDYGFSERLVASEPPVINLHVDEANEVIGNEFVPILNKARGAGFRVTAYTQTLSDIEARLGSVAKTGQVLGNLGTVIMFRVKEGKTAASLIEQLPNVTVNQLVHVSAANDLPRPEQGVYFSSHNEDRFSAQVVPMLESSDLLNLPKGQAFALLEGGKLYKLRMPLPKREALVLPESIEILIARVQAGVR